MMPIAAGTAPKPISLGLKISKELFSALETHGDRAMITKERDISKMRRRLGSGRKESTRAARWHRRSAEAHSYTTACAFFTDGNGRQASDVPYTPVAVA